MRGRKMSNQNGGSRTDTLIKLVLVFFLSLLSFSVGTFVGKQFSDSQHKIAELEGGENDATAASRSTASVSPEDAQPQPKNAITDDQVKSLSDEFVEKARNENGAD